MNSFEWFVWGLVIGHFWHPIWNAGKKIYVEAKKAHSEWRKDTPKQKDLF